MKKTWILLTAIFLAAGPALAQREKGGGAEAVVLPDVEMIDIPTAGILDYYGFMVKTRGYSGGGVVGALNFGVLERLNMGASMAVDRFVGSDTPIKMRKPEIQVKFRFSDGGYYMPAMALGYDSQGYYYDPAAKKYLEKGKGLYVVGSKEIGVSNLVLHGGLNVSDFDANRYYGFVGMNYTMESKVAFIVEYDNAFHNDDPARFNSGVRMYVTPYFQLDFALRELGRNGKFDNGWPRKSERIVQMRYTTSF